MITRSVLFSLKCIRNRLAAGLRPDPLGQLERSPRPPSCIRGWGPQEGREWEGRGRKRKGGREKKLIGVNLKGPTSKGGEEESDGGKRERRRKGREGWERKGMGKGPRRPRKKSWRRHCLDQ